MLPGDIKEAEAEILRPRVIAAGLGYGVPLMLR